ncbi:site-specific integrase [Chitinasiproducens palmae]|uniref:Site-specific recombinase XerD n=1 Tax=Chitinasiproducens palmae TaxID=1770053 RepID=A0A1H2PUF1_9BURK|nr:site-specific integrase [Chitinasiproducens palmae]SDV50427.1 Site-specific recombinase XerD [Chitinasiproducens palmae]
MADRAPSRPTDGLMDGLTFSRHYTRKDFSALRAYVERVDPAIIARTFYDPDEDPQAATPAAMARFLRERLDELVGLAIAHGAAPLAAHLRESIRQHGSARLSSGVYRMVEEAAQLALAEPHASHALGMWFRPLVARRLRAEGIETIGALVAFCNRRGGTWWRSVPRIGAGRAQRIVAWLRRHEATIGARVDADVDAPQPVHAIDPVELAPAAAHPAPAALAPLERIRLPHALSGAAGTNRSALFCYVDAADDLSAVQLYLHRHQAEAATLRAYTREIERFMLWAVVLRAKPLSSLDVADCLAYRSFLQSPDLRFTGERATRRSPRWRPFTAQPLSPPSQRQAITILHGLFAWLVDVRYLAGNPWALAGKPAPPQRDHALQVERALPAALWARVRAELDRRCTRADAAPWRTARAALLLLGDSGLRRDEAAKARRDDLHRATQQADGRTLWALTVTGRRAQRRVVPVSPATIEALRAHWRDRNEDFDMALGGPLVAPLRIPSTPSAQAKHRDGERQPYSADRYNTLVTRTLRELATTMRGLDPASRELLANTSAHALRHTFGAGSVAAAVPLDVVQKVLGHVSMQTTAAYVQREQERTFDEVARFFAARDGQE